MGPMGPMGPIPFRSWAQYLRISSSWMQARSRLPRFFDIDLVPATLFRGDGLFFGKYLVWTTKYLLLGG